MRARVEGIAIGSESVYSDDNSCCLVDMIRRVTCERKTFRELISLLTMIREGT